MSRYEYRLLNPMPAAEKAMLDWITGLPSERPRYAIERLGCAGREQRSDYAGQQPIGAGHVLQHRRPWFNRTKYTSRSG